MHVGKVARTPSALGKVGEKYVGLWASQVGISVNPVSEDEQGWDFLLEMPRAHSVLGDTSLDLMPCDQRCFVQVKTLASSDGRSKIKLSNWRRMVTDPSPWFVLIVVVDDINEPSSAFLIHIDEPLIASVLRRLRETPEEEFDELHKHTMDVTWSSGQQLDALHGVALQSALKFHIGDDLNAYMSRKIALTRSVGYDDAPFNVRTTFKASSDDEANEILTDFLVGLRDEIPFTTFEVSEVRFEIPKQAGSGDAGTISLDSRKPDGPARIILRKSDLSETVELECEMFVSHPYLPAIPERFHKFRFVAPFFSAVLRRVGEKDASTVDTAPTVALNLAWTLGPVPPDQDCLLAELGIAARAAIMLHTSASDPIVLGLAIDEDPIWHENFCARGVLDANSFALWSTIDATARIASHFRLSEKTSVRADSLMNQAQAIRFLATTLELKGMTAQFKATTELGEVPDASEAALAAVTSVRIGARVLGRCFALVGSPRWTRVSPQKIRLEVAAAELRIISEWQMLATEWSHAEESARLRVAQQVLEDQGIQIVVFTDSNAP